MVVDAPNWNIEATVTPIYYELRPTEQGRANLLPIYYEPRPTEQGRANLLPIYYDSLFMNLGRPNRGERTYFPFIMIHNLWT